MRLTLENDARFEFLFCDCLQADWLRGNSFVLFLTVGVASRLFTLIFIELLDLVFFRGLECVFIVALVFLVLFIG